MLWKGDEARVNVEPPDFALSLPDGVKPAVGTGVYLVRSATRRRWHRVDVALLQCDCESATKGHARRAAIANGGCPPYEQACPHLKLALPYDAMVLRAALQSLGERRKR